MFADSCVDRINTNKEVRRSTCLVSWLGIIDYQKSYALQKQILSGKLNNLQQNTLLLLEHPPTITLGKSGKIENLLISENDLELKGIPIIHTDRGGDITYHGPGQLVIYPIIDLSEYGKNIHWYVFSLQEVAIRVLADFSIESKRDNQYIGVWVNEKKIAAIGVAVHKWITTHGMALNIAPNMKHFDLINPCGIRDKGVTSMSQLLGKDIPIENVINSFVERFSNVFNAQTKWVKPDFLEELNDTKAACLV